MNHKLHHRMALLLSVVLLATACTFNPMKEDNHLTGSPMAAATGGLIGVGAGALAGASKTMLGVLGIGGASVGYYYSTLRSASAGILQQGGQVYTQGEFVGIEIPSDYLFEPNTDEFLPGTEAALASIASVLKRYPYNDVLISGNTSGYAMSKWELRISEARARQIAGYLWLQGIVPSTRFGYSRRVVYVGFGNFFPVANNIHFSGIRANSRVQITAYPPNAYSFNESFFQTVNGCSVMKQLGYKDAGSWT